MGCFTLQIGRGPIVRLRNTLHSEGALLLWQSAFGGSLQSFQIGIAGINVPDDTSRRPDSFVTPVSPSYMTGNDLAVERLLADILTSQGKEAGAGTPEHAALMAATGAQAVTLQATACADGVKIATTAAAEFVNNAPWSPTPDPDTGETYYHSEDPWTGDGREGFPWARPHVFPGGIGEDYGFAEENVWRGSSMPVGAVYLTAGDPAVLVASAVLRDEFVIKPQSLLSVGYEGRLDCPGMTQAFTLALAKAACGQAALSLTNVQAGLGSVAAPAKAWNAAVGRLGELDGEICTGYARAASSAWSVAAETGGAKASPQLGASPFGNTGAAAWSPAASVFLFGTLSGTGQLLAVKTMASPLELPAGDTYSPTLEMHWNGEVDG